MLNGTIFIVFLKTLANVSYYANFKKRSTFLFANKTDLKSVKKFMKESDFEDFQIIFHFRPIPELYL